MMPDWTDLNARARGLSTRLLTPEQLVQLEAAPDMRSLVAELARVGVAIPDGGSDAAGIEREVRRACAALLGIVIRWCGPRANALALMLEEEDWRSVRSLLRGAAQGAPAAQRLAGLLPTPTLPESALKELAGQPTVREVVTLLVAWRHPYGPALTTDAYGPHPDLLSLEQAVARVFVSRSLRTARRSGRRGPLMASARLTIDLENAQTALALVGGESYMAARFHLDGGERIPKDVFRLAVMAGSTAAAADLLAARFAPAPLAAALRDAAGNPGGLESAILAARVGMLDDARRLAPLGPVTLLHFLFRLRYQLVELRRIVWTVALASGDGGRQSPLAAVS